MIKRTDLLLQWIKMNDFASFHININSKSFGIMVNNNTYNDKMHRQTVRKPRRYIHSDNQGILMLTKKMEK